MHVSVIYSGEISDSRTNEERMTDFACFMICLGLLILFFQLTGLAEFKIMRLNENGEYVDMRVNEA